MKNTIKLLLIIVLMAGCNLKDDTEDFIDQPEGQSNPDSTENSNNSDNNAGSGSNGENNANGGTNNNTSDENKITIPGSNIELVMLQIEGGAFVMGSPASEHGHKLNENPRTANGGIVTLSGFYMSKYEITQAQYEAVMGMGINPSRIKGKNLPVEYVSWYDAAVFCNELSVLAELTPVYTITDRNPMFSYPIQSAVVTADWDANGYRLPTEAEWEYACRAGTTTAFNWGSNFINSNQANYNASDIDLTNTAAGTYRETTTEAGTFAPNAWGLYDMHGNVCEWCWDLYAESYNDAGGSANPKGAESSYHVVRGGSFYDAGEYNRSALRLRNSPYEALDYIGFRVVRNR